MSGPQVDTLVEEILAQLPRHVDLDAAVAAVVANMSIFMPDFAARMADEIEEARTAVARQLEDVEILHRHSVMEKRERWYFGAKPSDLHWPALRSYLLGKGLAESDVEAIDEASNEVVSLLENPRKDDFQCRGLVVGHVQSGKTANMTAVMAKALDAGYNTVIVLAGLTNKLRYQTQMRMFRDLVMRHPLDWHPLTPNVEHLDFRAPPQGGFLSHSDKAQLAVVKKNPSPLKQLKIAVQGTLPVALKRLRILVIDDECDQASVNGGRGEYDVTAINGHIRELLAMIPAVSYVGYTATPFANVLVDPFRKDMRGGIALDDLYPRDFITALPSSPNYFGTEKLFGRIPDDPDNILPEEEGLDMIRSISDEDEQVMQPVSAAERESFEPPIAPSLATAIRYFLACCAARRARGDEGEHMTMLVHTSAYVVAHNRIAVSISEWVDSIRAELADPASSESALLAEAWNEEQGKLPEDITAAPAVTIDEIFAHLPAVLDALEFPVENGVSEHRINYENEPKTYIVTGGSILARGLTLDGLMVSYFMRGAKQYDTLLQMGRWFGFRKNYEDLPRIWMPLDLKLAFRSLARVEREIREDIGRYHDENKTPMDIAVRIRAIPGMAITGATKMRAAKTCAISYWGTHRQTFRFRHHDEDELDHNWKRGTELLEAATTEGCWVQDWKAPLWTGVPRDLVLRFLERYRFHPDHAELQPGVLLPFLRQNDDRLATWNVGIVTSGKGKPGTKALGPLADYGLVNRARLRDGGASADIKALMSKSDVWLDCEGRAPGGEGWDELKASRQSAIGQQPLLLLYPIDRESPPAGKGANRIPLDASTEVLGIGIVFPGSVTEGGDFVSVELVGDSVEDLERIEAEESAQIAMVDAEEGRAGAAEPTT
ncbi:Z1 domain-containing protein [Sphingopyxis sp. 22461]|uniref:Z1 domain-containing protein n=1 Tax=Sphingopyxis sp. 22461 TaxID=3453923 RepID=UPI003F84ACCE